MCKINNLSWVLGWELQNPLTFPENKSFFAMLEQQILHGYFLYYKIRVHNQKNQAAINRMELLDLTSVDEKGLEIEFK